MREKLLAVIADDFTINRMVKGRRKRGKGKPAYKCRNKIVRVRDTFELQSLDGDTLYEIQERKARIREAMAIHDGSGDKVAEIVKREIGVVRDNYTVKVRGERNWEIHGSVLEHDYTFREGGRVIATIHEKWIAPVQDFTLLTSKKERIMHWSCVVLLRWIVSRMTEGFELYSGGEVVLCSSILRYL